MKNIIDNKECLIYNLNRVNNRKEKLVKNKKIKIARVERDMSQEDLANIVGASRQTIGLIESGNYNPTLKLCIAICRALNKSLNDLFWEEI